MESGDKESLSSLFRTSIKESEKSSSVKNAKAKKSSKASSKKATKSAKKVTVKLNATNGNKIAVENDD